MKDKIIIYCRKSTDREDKQVNSLGHQLNNCHKIIELNSFEISKEIVESRSAKIEGTRHGFKEMIKICKTGKIDYIVIDEPKRLSRNNIDTSRIIDLLDKKQIKGIISNTRQYYSKHSRDKFFLQFDLSLSKMDNEDRSKDVKDKMQTCINNTRRFLGKAPFGYKNIIVTKGHKEIIISKKESKIVREIFDLRIENKAFSTIGLIIKEKYGERIGMSIKSGRIQQMIVNKFYYGVFTWNGKEIIGNHKPLILKEIYDKANSIGKGVYEETKTIENRPRNIGNYYFKGFIKDTSGILLCSYQKKGHTYYMSQPRSDERININENIIFEKFGEILKQFETPNKKLDEIDKDIIIDLLKQDEIEKLEDNIDIKKEIKKLENKQDKLLDMRLNEKISEELYLVKNNKFENDIKSLKENKNKDKNYHYEEKTQILFELVGNQYRSYNRVSNEVKALLIKNYLFELSINTKKELTIKEKSFT